MRKDVLFMAGAIFGALIACADQTVTYETRIVASSTQTISLQTANATEFPSDLGVTPSFWFDASDTNGWVIGSGGTISNVPSKVAASTRYLKSYPEAGDSWTEWDSVGYVNAPILETGIEALGGGSAIDFGAVKSGRGLVFNAFDSGSGTASNSLVNIGTVCAVYDSSQSGGFLFAGGYGTGSNRDGYIWARGVDTVKSGANGQYYYSNPVLQYFDGTVRQDGFPSAAKTTGLSGGWQVLTFMKKSGAVGREATGLGFNEGRNGGSYKYSRSGGMKIAEMIVFSELLDVSQVERVESYLQRKWFGRALAGQNGNASVGLMRVATTLTTSGIKATLDVQEGERLEIGRIKGGRATDSSEESKTSMFQKTGSGTLDLYDASRYAGPVAMKGGTLAFGGKVAPSFAQLPEKLFIHLDASDLPDGVLTSWTNLTDAKYMNAAIRFDAESGREPTVARDSLLGATAVDFGIPSSSGAYMSAAYGGKTNALKGVTTVIGVMRGKGGAEISGGTGGVKYVDGVRIDASDSVFYNAGWHVMATQTSGFDLQYLGRSGSNCGGLAIAELLVWNRILRDDELMEACAYLSEKWLGKPVAGYVRTSASDEVDVKKINVSEPSAIDVPAGVVRVGALNLSAPLVKKGLGTLEVLSDVSGAEDRLAVAGGKVLRGANLDPSSNAEIALSPALHLDATDEASLEIVEESNEKRIRAWIDKERGNSAMMTTSSYRPWLNETDTLNGKNVVDFGVLGRANGGRYMVFAQAIEAVKAAFIVWNTDNGGGCLLANVAAGDMVADDENSADFRRGAPTSGSVVGNASCPFLLNPTFFSSVYTNGVQVSTPGTAVPSTGWMLVELYPIGGLRAGGLAYHYANVNRAGGQRLAEVILYDRTLSAREKVATRNYLMKKWFGLADSDLQPLPGEAPSSTEITPASYVVEGETELNVAEGSAIGAKTLSGTGNLSKTGDGTLSLFEFGEFSGTVSVSSGSLALTSGGVFPSGLVEDGLIMHLDATQGLTLEGTNVTAWSSVLNDGWTAVPGTVTGKSTWYPTLRTNDLKGKQTVDMCKGTSGQRAQFFRFTNNGEYSKLSGIKTVFWVLGSQNGGGYLLGGGNNSYGSFFRGDFTASTRLIGATQADKAVRDAAWQVDGTNVLSSQEGVLSGGWNIVSMVISGGASTAAEGLAYDPRVLEASPLQIPRAGSQRLAEVLIYNRALDNTEVQKVTNYLRAKWMPDYEHSFESTASLSLSPESTFDCGGATRHIAVISGSGSITNGSIMASRILYDAAVGSGVQVHGTFVLPERLEIEFQNLAAGGALSGQAFRVIGAESIAGIDNLSSVSVVGDAIPADAKISVRWQDGYLTVKFMNRGTLFILR